jgi:hypothetical protein
MIDREGAAFLEAGHAVMAYLRNADFKSVTILAVERDLGSLVGNYESSVPADLDQADVQSYADSFRIEIGLAGAFAQCLHVGGFTPGGDAPETYIRAMNACLKGSEDDAAQRAVARAVRHGNVSVGQNVMDEALSSPYARDILFEVSDHWRLVETIAAALMEGGTLSQTEVHQIIRANEL